MKRYFALLMLVLISLVQSCGPAKTNAKRVLIISSGKLKVDEQNQKLVVFEPGGQHNEQELTFNESGAVTIMVRTPKGEVSFVMPESGAYLLNLKTDTVVGGAVTFGTAGRPAYISAEQLDQMIDSTKKLMIGANTSDEKKTYFLPPMTIKKISASANASLLSPYKLIPAKIEVDEKGNAPEVYKFFTNTQKREALADLMKRMTK